MPTLPSFDPSDVQLGNRLVQKLIRPGAQPAQVKVEFAALMPLHGALCSEGLRLVDREPYGPGLDGERNGWMLFYLKGHVLVRIKTNGERSGSRFRQGLPHMSISLLGNKLDKKPGKTGAIDLSFGNEVAKMDCRGLIHAKVPPKIPAFSATLTPAGRIVADSAAAAAALQAKIAGETWADETHFVFPDLAFDETGLDRLFPGA
jgi:hypothetical protein